MNIIPALFFIVAMSTATAFAQKSSTYLVKDSLGRPIIQTTNASLAYSMRNVVLDSTSQDMITVCPLNNKAIIDDLKSSIESKIGKPTKGEYYYRVEWNTRDSTKIVIVKPASSRAILYCNRKGVDWLKLHEPGVIDTLK
jgi:hypothetical protein